MIVDSHAHYAHASFSGSFRYLSWEDNWTLKEGTLEDLLGQMEERGIAMSVEPGIGLARSLLYQYSANGRSGCHG